MDDAIRLEERNDETEDDKHNDIHSAQNDEEIRENRLRNNKEFDGLIMWEGQGR